MRNETELEAIEVIDVYALTRFSLDQEPELRMLRDMYAAPAEEVD